MAQEDGKVKTSSTQNSDLMFRLARRWWIKILSANLRSDFVAMKGFIRSLWHFLTPSVRRSLVNNAVARALLNLVDLVGTVLVAILAALLLWSSSGSTGNPIARRLLETLGLSYREAALLVIAVALLLFSVKAWIGLTLSRNLAQTLNRYGANSSTALWATVTNEPINRIALLDRASLNFSLGAGVNSALQATTSLVSLLVDATLILLLVGVLLVSSPLSTLLLVGYAATILIAVDLLSGRRIQRYGSQQAAATEGLNRVILETMSTYRERTVFGRMQSSRERFSLSRHELARLGTSFEWVSQVPRYATELGLLIVLSILVAMTALAPHEGPPSLDLLVFYVAAARLIPAVGPIQSSFIAFRLHSGLSSTFFDLTKQLRPAMTPLAVGAGAIASPVQQDVVTDSMGDGKGKHGYRLLLEGVTFSYAQSDMSVLNNVSLDVDAGERVAIVGESGAGKTTLVDILLGLIEPNEGSATIEGQPARRVREAHPGSVAYVPQSVSLIYGTLAENVALGIDSEEIETDRVQRVLKTVHLDEFLADLSAGVETILGDGARPISGGQLQRLGLARALYQLPRLLVLDESTSALDAHTEARVLESLDAIPEMTVVFIAHSSGPLRFCNRILRLSRGILLPMETSLDV